MELYSSTISPDLSLTGTELSLTSIGLSLTGIEVIWLGKGVIWLGKGGQNPDRNVIYVYSNLIEN